MCYIIGSHWLYTMPCDIECNIKQLLVNLLVILYAVTYTEYHNTIEIT